MLSTMIGWYAREVLGCRFSSIRFEETIDANSTIRLLIGDSTDGAIQKEKTDGYNFVMNDMYSYTSPGVVKCRVSPDDNQQKSFYVDAYAPSRTSFVPSKLVTVDLAVEYTNNESQANDVYLSFNGFWIPEDRMAEFSLLAESMVEGLFVIGKMNEAMLVKQDETNSLLRSLVTSGGGTVGDFSGGDGSYYGTRIAKPGAVCRRNR